MLYHTSMSCIPPTSGWRGIQLEVMGLQLILAISHFTTQSSLIPRSLSLFDISPAKRNFILPFRTKPLNLGHSTFPCYPVSVQHANIPYRRKRSTVPTLPSLDRNIDSTR